MFSSNKKNQFYYEDLLIRHKLNKKEIKSEDIDSLKLKELEESNSEILNKYPGRIVVPEIMERIERKKIKYVIDNVFSMFIRFIPVMAVLILVITVIPNNLNYNHFFLRLKGAEPRLVIYKQTGTEILKLNENMNVEKGDNLQIAYSASGWEYGSIFSIDGNGKITLHYPLEFDQTKKIKSGSLVLLPYSFQLDNAPLYEKFYFVLSHNDFDLKPIIDNLVSDKKINDDILINNSDLFTSIVTLYKGPENED